MQAYENFDVRQVPLAGTNLIEASAGTGKTYSIALLVLRLILDKGLAVNQILMVTFTKAAVAELESRIRLFIRLAYKSALGEPIGESSIQDIVQTAVAQRSEDEVKRVLQAALLLLDEVAIQTIHGFCQSTLEEFALEANMRYGPEVITDETDVVGRLANDFWRTKVTTLPVAALSMLDPLPDRATLIKGIKDHLEGKVSYGYDPAADYTLPEGALKFAAINAVLPRIHAYKEQHNLLTYDDMIRKMHEALANDRGSALRTQLRQKFKAVFIDEFQDTDKLQYEIFKAAFHDADSLILYIGDPKQSIYSWRKADLNTYLRASREVDRLYGMNFNYRSSESMIEAMNDFFLPEAGFDTFACGREENQITYKKVESPRPNNKGQLKKYDEAPSAISIFEVSKSAEVIAPVVAQVTQLLNEKIYAIEKGGVSRPLVPGDIGILVRSNRQASDLKEALSRAGIPAVTIDDTKVFASAEAEFLLYLLEAFNKLSQGAINKALLSPFTGMKLHEILALDPDGLSEVFRKYRNIWRQSGIMPALRAFIADFGVQQLLLSKRSELGERAIANLYHLTELVHKAESTRQYSPAELIAWLHAALNDALPAEDEYEQRIENDENAVNIITIHKSKGLQYNVVIAPYLDLITYTSHNDISWRDPLSGAYMTGNKKEVGAAEKGHYTVQTAQENRRLLYVAITRAVYKCFLVKINTSRGPYSTKNSALSAFTDVLKNRPKRHITFEEGPALPPNYAYQKNSEEKPSYATAEHFRLAETNWRRVSFSYLAAEHKYHPKPEQGQFTSDYDRFVFSQLVKGPKTGDMLHYIFEHIDFANDAQWEPVIAEALSQFLPKHRLTYGPMLKQMLEETLNSKIFIGGEEIRLANIQRAHRINELEFDFGVRPFHPAELNGYTNPDETFALGPNYEIEGMMNGLIDLFFEHRGKYYILDWKSNFLGDTPECYGNDKLKEAMKENNYHLQHLIYTAAVDLFLKSRIPDYDFAKHFGGVIYVFLRGTRKGSANGIFTTRPKAAPTAAFIQ